MPAPATTDATRSATPAPTARDADPSRSAGEVVSDASITARVKASLIGDDLTKARNINVDTMNAAVT
ncbi:MAG TPA: phospholipid-binding protein, partial [Burkholderiaceae bacterium]|nr:phospholipid-binding protein [Burkholderiaceae bacterium]